MTPDAETRKRIVAEVIQRAEERNNAEVSVSAVRFWDEQENSYGLPAYVLKRMVHPKEREKLEKWSQLHARKRDPRGKKKILVLLRKQRYWLPSGPRWE